MGEWGTALAGGAQVLGMVTQGHRNRQAMKQQEQLQNNQYENQKNLNKQGHDLSMDMWNKTNVGPQMEKYKEAGLNPALMYGTSGATGTTNSGSGGGATGGQAPNQAPMDMSNLMMGAQLELMKAQARKTNVEANNMDEGGVGYKNKQADTDLKNITTGITAQNIVNKKQEYENLVATKKLTGAQEKLVNQQYNVAVVQAGLQQAGIEKTEAETKAIVGKLQIAWKELGLEKIRVQIEQGKLKVQEGSLSAQQKKLSIDAWNSKIAKFKAEIDAEFPSLNKVTGKAINELYDWISNNTVLDIAGKIFGNESYSRDENERTRKVNP